MKTETFDVHSLPLSGIRMVDASAGTGKTYSIALLVIRLILEKDMDIRSVLVVTFTRAATREIQGRIQDFLMELKACCDDPALMDGSPLHTCLSPDAERRAQQQKKITEALLFIDEAPIHTIHAFCQKMLSTHPFETGNLFSPGMLEDNTDLHARFINSRWRKIFETLPSELFSCITPVVGKRGDIAPLVSALLSEQHIEFPPDVDPEAALAAYEKRMADFDAREEALAADSVVWEELSEVLEEICGEYSPKSPPKYIQNLTAAANMADVKKEVFTQAGDVKKLIEKKKKLCSTVLIGALISIHREKTACTEEFESLCRQAAQRLACILAQEAAEDIRAYKKKNSLLEFDDLIANLHGALFSDSGQNTAQAAAMGREYTALFIDEFQDTDRKQFEILHALFSDKPSFYIGDPKQSIYGWRGADLDTYFAVRSTTAHAVYSMKECFRSTPKLTRAFNTFFSASSSFFAHDELTYTPVEGKNRENEKKHTPLTIYRGGSSKDDLIDTAAEVVTVFFTENRDESLQNSAVLVRSHREAAQMKQALAQRGVPAVTIDESSLYATAGAEELKTFLEALFFQEDRRIRRALLSHLAGLRAQDLAAMKEGEYESHMRRFAAYGEIWKKRGIAAALKACISEYGLRERVFEDRTIMEGERLFADLMHLLDCMVSETVKNGLSMEEQLLFLQKQTARESRQKRRVENDSNSLQIVTIHKSKGLTYDHVFCPFLNVSASRPPGPLTLIPKNGGYRFVTTDEDTQCIEKESLRENRRLTYVAMTRARFSCTLCIAKKGKYATGHLKEWVESIPPDSGVKIVLRDDDEKNRTIYHMPHRIPAGTKKEIRHRENLISRRDISSFSALSRMHGLPPADSLETEHTPYDQWIFSRGGGALLGNFLHDIFETIDFTTFSSEEIRRCGSRHPLVFRDEDMPRYHELCSHTLGARLEAFGRAFNLGAIPRTATVREMEFYFSLRRRGGLLGLGEVITNYFNYDFKPHREQMPGFIKGFIDLIFEHHGRYYILDWKSNSLGKNLQMYENDSLEQAMCDSNYHLQYVLYAVALKRYMNSRGIDFEESFGGVYYVFLRGVREGKTTGVYYAPPQKVLPVVEEVEEFFG